MAEPGKTEDDICDQLAAIKNPPIDEILNDPEFLNQNDNILSLEESKKLLLNRYPDFNFDGFSDDDTNKAVGMVNIIDRQLQKSGKLSKMGEVVEAFALAKKMRLINDPYISKANTSIRNVLETVHGNLDMASSFLRLNKETGKGWVNFIVRTWGEKPSDYK